MANPDVGTFLKMQRCPHCAVDTPNLKAIYDRDILTSDSTGANNRLWQIYKCARCGGLILAARTPEWATAREIYPSNNSLADVLPSRVKEYLQQAIDSTFAPSGSTILCASSVDAMLKEKGYKAGTLYKRIEKAVEDGVITSDMAQWAHQVRLDANDERHADESSNLPTIEDAKRSIEFTRTLAEILFVLPSKVLRGIASSAVKENPVEQGIDTTNR